LGTHSYALAPLDGGEGLKNGGHKRSKGLYPIRAGDQCNESDGSGDLVAFCKPVVDRDEGVVTLRREPKKVAVLDTRPAHLSCGTNLIT
jgi:hypothetical protein